MISILDRRQAIALIEQAVAQGAPQHKACEVVGITPRTYQRWTRDGGVKADGRPDAERPAPANRLTEAERARILAVCNQPEYSHLPPSQIVPILADQGEYIASESSFYRVLREAGQVYRRGRAQPPTRHARPKAYQADGPNQIWSWDITFLKSAIAGQFYRLYLAMDIYSRKIVGWEVHERESADLAAQMIRKACLAEGITQSGLVLHSDNGAPMKSATMLATLQQLGVVPSFSRPSVSNDNPYSESLFGSLKYSPAYPDKPFDSIDAARAWVHTFVTWYNGTHRHSGIQYVTPNQRHRGEDDAILAKRKAVYEAAKARQPARWSGAIRNWDKVAVVYLNPDKPELLERPEVEAAAA